MSRRKEPSDNVRVDQLKEIAADFCRVHDEWCNDKNRNVPDQIYWDAASSLVDSFQGDIPAECRALALAVDAFAEAIEEYDERENPRDLSPSDSFWAAREKVESALKALTVMRRELPALESIAELARLPNINHVQIAKIYGFIDRYGQWMPHLVQRELDKPGSVINTPGSVDGRDWCDPRIPKDGNEAAEKHTKAIEEKRQRATKAAQPCRETPRELWEQKVSVRQAAKMLCVDEGEVAQLFGEYDAEREKSIASGEIVDATTQAARELKAKGKTIAQIADTLGISEQQVTAALKAKVAA